MKSLTEKQEEIIDYIKRFIESEGYPPSIAEIGDHFKITAASSYNHLLAIKKKGYVDWETGRARTLRLTESAIKQSKNKGVTRVVFYKPEILKLSDDNKYLKKQNEC